MVTKKSVFDIHPQYLRIGVTESAANTFTQKEENTPIAQVGKGNTLVMELLKVFIQHSPGDLLDGDRIKFALYDRSKIATPSMEAAGVLLVVDIKSVGTSSNIDTFRMIDVTDGAGNGPIYARNKIYLSVEGVGQTAALNASGGILYRLVEIGPSELIGTIEA